MIRPDGNGTWPPCEGEGCGQTKFPTVYAAVVGLYLCPDCVEREGICLDGGREDPDGAYSTPLSAIESERVDWLWPGRVPLGMPTLLIGDPGLGKSLFSLDLAGQVSRDGGDLLILSAEDHPGATIRPRAEAVGADLDRLHIVGVRRDGIEDGLLLPDDAGALGDLVLALDARLVIVDPLTAHLPESVNSWRDQSVRRALAPLHRLAEQLSCAVLLLAHLNKARGADALYRAGGSIGIPAAVRSALLLARDPEDPDGERGSQRILAHVKCNVGEQADSLACRIESVQLDDGIGTARFTVTGTSTTTAADLLDAPSGEERTERDEAADFLRAELANGPRPARGLIRGAPCSERTLRKAKAELGIESDKDQFSGAWTWELPKAATPISANLQPSQAPHRDAVSKTATDGRLQGCTHRNEGAANGHHAGAQEEVRGCFSHPGQPHPACRYCAAQGGAA
jgi:AAA domain